MSIVKQTTEQKKESPTLGKIRRDYRSHRKNLTRFLTRKIILKAEYEKAAKQPIQENKVVFLELRLPSLSNSYKEIFDRLMRDYELDIHCHFFRTSFISKDARWKRIVDYVRDMATAKYVIYDEGSDIIGSLPKRDGQKILNTWHGTGAFKKFGYSTADKIFGADPDTMRHYPPHPDYDLVTVSSPEVVWAYIEAMGKEDKPGCIQPIGCSRTDVFYRQDFIDAAYEHLYAQLPQARGKKVILYAPTFRGRVAHATTPNMLDIETFYNHFADDYVLIFKHHPVVKSRPEIPEEFSEFAVDFTDSMTIEDLLCVSDICISDYSSLIYEYSLFEKPMLFFAYDLDDFFDWRGFYYDYDELTPGPICQTNAEMVDYIEHIDERFDKQQVHDFRERFMSSCDGHSTDRIMKAFFGDALEPYRRPKALTGTFSELPTCDLDYAEYFANIRNLAQIKEEAVPVYEAGCSVPVIPGTVALVCGETAPESVFDSVRREYARNNRGLVLIDDQDLTVDNAADYVAQLALCETIVSAGEPYILRLLQVRPETTVIQACPEVLPFEKRWGSTKAAKAGYYRELLDVAPFNVRYDTIMETSEADHDAYAINYPLKRDVSAPLMLGNIGTDVLFDAAFAREAMQHLDELLPQRRGRKVILMLTAHRQGDRDDAMELFELMHEDLVQDYFCIYDDFDAQTNQFSGLKGYISSFAKNPHSIVNEAEKTIERIREKDPAQAVGMEPPEPLTPMEELVAADIVITDYRAEAMLATAMGKPVLLWAPDEATYLNDENMLIDYSRILPSAHCETAEEVRDRILNIESYDYTSLNDFAQTHLKNCDGASAARLLDWLSTRPANK